MYIINDYQLIETDTQLFLSNVGKGAKISSPVLASILSALRHQEKLEISHEELDALAKRHDTDCETLKKILVTQLNVLKPMQSRKFPSIYINTDVPLVAELLMRTLSQQHHCHVVAEDCYQYPPNALVLFYRKNYSSTDFNRLYQHLAKDIYLITSGVVHKLLIIDNLYVKDSGLPSHFSNLHQLMTYLHSDIPATKNNWLLFYRELVKQQIDKFPDPQLNACQEGYIAYCLYQFAAQFTHLWGAPTPLDKVNWFWQADLTNFTIHQEVAIHSPFSEYDMRINLKNLAQSETV